MRILCQRKKLIIFRKFLVEMMSRKKSGKKKILVLQANKNKNSKLQQQLVFTLFASSLHNVILIVMLI